MLDIEQSRMGGGVRLRTELSLRGLRFAAAHRLLFERTDGSVPGIVFGLSEDRRHGNFHPLAWERICENAQWARRLEKVHTASRRVRTRAEWQWKELDCAHSSDALLMNVFCYPGVLARAEVRAMLGVGAVADPEFGVRVRTPLARGKFDRTEVDMTVGELMVEAKLTEPDFQRARAELVTRYSSVEEVFHVEDLPMKDGRHDGYQLVRGALAAYATGGSFCVLCDARRPDLVEGWYRVLRAVRVAELRWRLKLLTWQELSKALPTELREFLAVKYGIV